MQPAAGTSWTASLAVGLCPTSGTTLGSTYPINGSNQTTSINPLTGDVLVTYLNGTDIKLDVYQDELFPYSPHLTVTVSDGHDFARYGQMLNYLVTVSNTGYAAAENIVASLSTPGSGLDLANAPWECVGSDNSTLCASSNGTGAVLGRVTLPPRTSMTWVVGIPVASTTDGTIELDANATGTNMASDVDTLVIFRSGFDVANPDGTRAPN